MADDERKILQLSQNSCRQRTHRAKAKTKEDERVQHLQGLEQQLHDMGARNAAYAQKEPLVEHILEDVLDAELLQKIRHWSTLPMKDFGKKLTGDRLLYETADLQNTDWFADFETIVNEKCRAFLKMTLTNYDHGDWRIHAYNGLCCKTNVFNRQQFTHIDIKKGDYQVGTTQRAQYLTPHTHSVTNANFPQVTYHFGEEQTTATLCATRGMMYVDVTGSLPDGNAQAENAYKHATKTLLTKESITWKRFSGMAELKWLLVNFGNVLGVQDVFAPALLDPNSAMITNGAMPHAGPEVPLGIQRTTFFFVIENTTTGHPGYDSDTQYTKMTVLVQIVKVIITAIIELQKSGGNTSPVEEDTAEFFKDAVAVFNLALISRHEYAPHETPWEMYQSSSSPIDMFLYKNITKANMPKLPTDLFEQQMAWQCSDEDTEDVPNDEMPSNPPKTKTTNKPAPPRTRQPASPARSTSKTPRAPPSETTTPSKNPKRSCKAPKD